MLSGAVRVSWGARPARLAEAVFVRRVPVCRVVSAAEAAASVPVVSTVAAASRWGRAESSLSETCRVPCQSSSPTAPASRTVVPPRISHFKHSCFMRFYPVLRKNSLGNAVQSRQTLFVRYCPCFVVILQKVLRKSTVYFSTFHTNPQVLFRFFSIFNHFSKHSPPNRDFT